MSCCRNGKRILTQEPQTYPGTVRVDRAMYSAVLFQYTGNSRLTVVGSGTKTVYQFNGRGSRVVVNGRDVASLARVPLLVRV
ncbi:MAG TPA: hypothetical protein VND66_00910 [Acidobacteriaceae bacterium]|nr:hypothetical protein [Terriglobia bacterium]HVC89155.1 hypothetical protein [Acidobacteriaceae bacterium]